MTGMKRVGFGCADAANTAISLLFKRLAAAIRDIGESEGDLGFFRTPFANRATGGLEPDGKIMV